MFADKTPPMTSQRQVDARKRRGSQKRAFGHPSQHFFGIPHVAQMKMTVPAEATFVKLLLLEIDVIGVKAGPAGVIEPFTHQPYAREEFAERLTRGWHGRIAVKSRSLCRHHAN